MLFLHIPPLPPAQLPEAARWCPVCCSAASGWRRSVGTLRHVCMTRQLPRVIELRASLRDFLEGRLAGWVPASPIGGPRQAVALPPPQRARWARLAAWGWWVPVGHEAELELETRLELAPDLGYRAVVPLGLHYALCRADEGTLPGDPGSARAAVLRAARDRGVARSRELCVAIALH